MTASDRLEDQPADNAWRLEQLALQLAEGGITPFVGAGISKPLGFPLWGEFLKQAADTSFLAEKVLALVDNGHHDEAADVLHKECGHRHFEDEIRRVFGRPSPTSFTHELLTRITSGAIITTNFDDMVEQAFRDKQNPLACVVHGTRDVSTAHDAVSKGRRFLIKLHGTWSERTGRVLTNEEYQVAYGPNRHAIDPKQALPSLLERCLMVKPCLFLGCGLMDDWTMSVLGALAKKNPDVVHYAITERPAADAAFAAKRQRLSNWGVRPIWYGEGQHEKVVAILEQLAPSSQVPCFNVAPPIHRMNALADAIDEKTFLLDRTRAQIAERLTVAESRGGGAFQVVGVPGVGKSTLLHHWLMQTVSRTSRPVFGWSFYENAGYQPRSLGGFVRSVWEFSKLVSASLAPSPSQQLVPLCEAVGRCLASTRALLVLDGVDACLDVGSQELPAELKGLIAAIVGSGPGSGMVVVCVRTRLSGLTVPVNEMVLKGLEAREGAAIIMASDAPGVSVPLRYGASSNRNIVLRELERISSDILGGNALAHRLFSTMARVVAGGDVKVAEIECQTQGLRVAGADASQAAEVVAHYDAMLTKLGPAIAASMRALLAILAALDRPAPTQLVRYAAERLEPSLAASGIALQLDDLLPRLVALGLIALNSAGIILHPVVRTRFMPRARAQGLSAKQIHEAIFEAVLFTSHGRDLGHAVQAARHGCLADMPEAVWRRVYEERIVRDGYRAIRDVGAFAQAEAILRSLLGQYGGAGSRIGPERFPEAQAAVDLGLLIAQLRGYADPEVVGLFQRVRGHYTSDTVTPGHAARSLWGLWAYHLLRAEFERCDVALDLLQRTLEAAKCTDWLRIEYLGSRLQMEFWRGRLHQTTPIFCEASSTASTATLDGRSASMFIGEDPWVVACCYEAMSLV
ncbi:MAG: SIR2 family protein [Planctomycetes bacterium]|nr:SIR2 family protein [Planctomycetota bacterium]